MTTINTFNRRLPEGLVQNLEIGCGERKQKGYVGIDVRDCGQEIVWDVREGIPLPDNTVDSVVSSHTIEHFTDDEAREVFKEIHRVLKKGGRTYHILPHQQDSRAYYFDHKTFWNEDRIVSLIGVPGLEGFIIKANHMTTEKNAANMKELEFELIKITFKVLNKFCKFDNLMIYETEKYFLVQTVNKGEKYITKTTIGKIHWRVIESVYYKVGEQEIKLK